MTWAQVSDRPPADDTRLQWRSLVIMFRLSLKDVWRSWPWAAGGFALGAVVAYVLSQLVTPMYQSTAVLYYALSFGNTAGDLAQGSTYTESQMLSFGELATSQLVLDPVIKSEQLPTTSHELANQISVTTPRGTMIMQITTASADPEMAARVANAVAVEQKQAVESIAPRKDSGESTVTVRIIQQAFPAEFPSTPNTKLNMVLGALAGTLLFGGGAVLARYLDKRIKSAEDIAKVTDTPFLGTIRQIPEDSTNALIVAENPTSPVAEDFRQLRANLRYATMFRYPVRLVVSSSVSGEGKSTVAINLAVALAESGQTVLLVDADLRRPQVAAYTSVEGAVGLTDVLVGEQSLSEAIQPLGDTGVQVLTSGPIPPNPGELLGSRSMSELLQVASNEFNVVIIDTAPVLAVADAAILAHKGDGLVLVTRNRKTTTTALAQCKAKLDSAGVEVMGVLLNANRQSRDKNLKYYEYAPKSKTDSQNSTSAVKVTQATPENASGDSKTHTAEPIEGRTHTDSIT